MLVGTGTGAGRGGSEQEGTRARSRIRRQTRAATAHVRGTELSDRLPGYVDGNASVRLRSAMRTLGFLRALSPFLYRAVAAYAQINRRADASSSGRGNENIGRAMENTALRCNVRNPAGEISAGPCITVPRPPIISCLFRDPSPNNNRKDFAPLGRLIGPPRRVCYCVDISHRAGTRQ